jgi:hypothetical protein
LRKYSKGAPAVVFINRYIYIRRDGNKSCTSSPKGRGKQKKRKENTIYLKRLMVSVKDI